MAEKVEYGIRRKTMEMPAELETRFLRVGDKLYRSPHDKTPTATITPDKIKARNKEALPDLIKLAKENGWTSVKVSGDPEFQRAAYLAAAAQGITVQGYKPDELTRAAAERDQARFAGDPGNRSANSRTANQARDTKEQPAPRQDLAERFRRQSDAENAKDPELRKAQSHVAYATVIAGKRFPGDQVKQSEFVAERKDDLAARLGRGEAIAGIQVKSQQAQRERELTQTQVLQKTPSR